jgi:hypothetical protein
MKRAAFDVSEYHKLLGWPPRSTMLVNSIAVTYFIGTSAGARRLSKRTACPSIPPESKQLKRTTFPDP